MKNKPRKAPHTLFDLIMVLGLRLGFKCWRYWRKHSWSLQYRKHWADAFAIYAEQTREYDSLKAILIDCWVIEINTYIRIEEDELKRLSSIPQRSVATNNLLRII